jgi:DNA glycosylase AlkZ-like
MLQERLTAQLLAGTPATDPESVVARLLAVQGQDPRGARLAVRARSEGLSAADVDRALNEGRLLAHQGVVTVNGLFRPFALVRGRAVAIWRLRAGEVVIEPFGPMRREDAAALRAEAEGWLGFWMGMGNRD